MRLVLLPFITISVWLCGDAVALDRGDLPEQTAWYLHLDLEQMQNTVTGQYISDFVDEDVFEEIREETGLDLRNELEGITAFGSSEDGEDAAVVFHGRLSKETKDTLLELLRDEANDIGEENLSGVSVYSFEDLDFDHHHHGHSRDHDDDDSGPTISIDGDETVYLGFGKANQTMITPNRRLLESWAAAGGRFRGVSQNYPGALLVLEADRSLVQGGVRKNVLSHGPWNSSIGKSMEQIAVILFDEAGRAALDVSILTTTPDTAESLHNVVKGLIALKSLAADDEPEIAAILGETDVDLAGSQVTLKARIDPEVFRDLVN